MLLRNGAPAPTRNALRHLGEARGHAEQGIPVAASSFQEQHLDRRISAQTVGEDAARWAAADNDVVVTHPIRPVSMKIGFDDVVRDTKRLGGDRERRVYGCRGRQKGSVDNKEVEMVPGAAEWIERRSRWVGPDAHGAALMRGRSTVERLGQHDWIAGRPQSLFEGLNQSLMCGPV